MTDTLSPRIVWDNSPVAPASARPFALPSSSRPSLDTSARTEGARLHEAFTASARRTPMAPAVVSGGVVTSYADLDRRSDRLARRLAARRGAGRRRRHLDGALRRRLCRPARGAQGRRGVRRTRSCHAARARRRDRRGLCDEACPLRRTRRAAGMRPTPVVGRFGGRDSEYTGTRRDRTAPIARAGRPVLHYLPRFCTNG